MKYKLQKELEQDLIESNQVLSASLKSGNEQMQMVAEKYSDAINRIVNICKDRNRF